MKASLVYDGGDSVNIPESMGSPLPDQMTGTIADRLGELAARACYDSLGLDADEKRKGRTSAKLHAHLIEVKNLSVHEHFNFTLRFGPDHGASLLLACLNRKGVWVECPPPEDVVGRGLDCVEVTANLRAVLEWGRHYSTANSVGFMADRLGHTLAYHAHALAPQVVPLLPQGTKILDATVKTSGLTADQAWITLYIYGSRGLTHEQVRHRFAMSQRSTRYVDESESEYIEHPLITKYLQDGTVGDLSRDAMMDSIFASRSEDRSTYRSVVSALEEYLLRDGTLDRTSARKQARGAARGYLGHALASEMLFSAPASGWRWMLQQRTSRFADAEIRRIYEQVLECLQASRHARFFEDMTLVPSPDGIGRVLAE